MRLAGWRCTLGAGLLFEVGYLEAGRGHRLLGHDLRTHAAERFGWTRPMGELGEVCMGRVYKADS